MSDHKQESRVNSKQEVDYNSVEFLQKRINSPKVDLYENESQVLVKIELAGMDRDTIRVNLKESQLLLVGGVKSEEYYDNFTNKYKECRYNSIMRRIKLPSHVYYNKNFTYVDGVFTIIFDKKTKDNNRGKSTVMHTTEYLQVVKETQDLIVTKVISPVPVSNVVSSLLTEIPTEPFSWANLSTGSWADEV
jgi:HSP20 family molecular chaperone IbpA